MTEAETSLAASNEEDRRRTLSQMIELFVKPEVERRQVAGTLQGTFILAGFQVVWTGGGASPPTVRLDSEMRLVARMEGTLAPGAKIGDSFQPDDTTKVEAIHLINEEAGRFAHFSALRIAHRWYYAFDFRHQQEAARRHLAVAEEFWAVADQAFRMERQRAFIDNAHSAAELVTKVDLLLLNQIGEGRLTHGSVRGIAEKFFHLAPLHALVERLHALRMPARYLLAEFSPDLQEIDEMHNALAQWIEHARVRTREISAPSLA